MRKFEDIQIAVAGTGYVGLSIATLLAQHHKVTAVDVIAEKVEKINNRISPIQDDYIEKYLAEKPLQLTATLDGASAYRDADFVVIAAPTNYDPVKNFFDTHCIEEVIDLVLEVNPEAVMVIKSTIPVGYCRSLYLKYAEKFKAMGPLADGRRRELRLLFSPEFLRESKALYDNLYPSRIIVGYPKMLGQEWKAEAAAKAAQEAAALLASITGPTLNAPMGGTVIEIQVKPGDDVKKGQPVLMYEAMKMQNEIESEMAGKVKRILVKPGQVVGTNDPLIEFED